jgi:hypothetical protein
LSKAFEELLIKVTAQVNERFGILGAWPALGADARKEIEKRVAPSALGRYLNTEAALNLMALDLRGFSRQVIRYSYIDSYRSSLKKGNAGQASALAFHLYTLRRSELYMTLGRGKSALDFCHSISSAFGFGSRSQSQKFESEFKKRFSHDLRERHRMVHFHERPSLATRVADVLETVQGKDAVLAAVTDILTRVEPLRSEIPDELLQAALDRKKTDRQAVDAWEIFSKAVLTRPRCA